LKDDGRPIGIGFQEQVSNHPRLQWLRVTVVSAGARVRETNENKPTDDASLGSRVVKTRGEWNLWEKPVGALMTGQAATGVKGA
jgi:hypothetical protein